MDRYGARAVRAELGMVKAHVSKVVLAVLDRTIQVCGALGYSGDLPVERGTGSRDSARSATGLTSCTSRCWPATF